MPKVYKTEKGRPYMRTTGGRTVGVSEDAEGRIFMFDRAGNLYYDTGDRKLGFYIVRAPIPALFSRILPFLMEAQGCIYRQAWQLLS